MSSNPENENTSPNAPNTGVGGDEEPIVIGGGHGGSGDTSSGDTGAQSSGGDDEPIVIGGGE